MLAVGGIHDTFGHLAQHISYAAANGEARDHEASHHRSFRSSVEGVDAVGIECQAIEVWSDAIYPRHPTDKDIVNGRWLHQRPIFVAHAHYLPAGMSLAGPVKRLNTKSANQITFDGHGAFAQLTNAVAASEQKNCNRKSRQFNHQYCSSSLSYSGARP